MSLSFNNTEQTLTVLDGAGILVLDAPAGVKFPANTFSNIQLVSGNIGFMDRSPVTSTLFASRLSTTVSLDFNNRLHYASDRFNAIMLVSDIEYIKEHHEANINVRVDSSAPRITALENRASVPLGTITMFNSATAPVNWSVCNGQTVNGWRTPDLRGRMVVGTRNLGTGGWLGEDPYRKSNFYLHDRGGEYTHPLSEAEMPSHKHVMPWGEAWYAGAPWGYYSGRRPGGNDGADSDNIWRYSSGNVPGNAGNGTAPGNGDGSVTPHDNMPPYIEVQYIMYTG